MRDVAATLECNPASSLFAASTSWTVQNSKALMHQHRTCPNSMVKHVASRLWSERLLRGRSATRSVFGTVSVAPPGSRCPRHAARRPWRLRPGNAGRRERGPAGGTQANAPAAARFPIALAEPAPKADAGAAFCANMVLRSALASGRAHRHGGQHGQHRQAHGAETGRRQPAGRRRARQPAGGSPDCHPAIRQRRTPDGAISGKTQPDPADHASATAGNPVRGVRRRPHHPQ